MRARKSSHSSRERGLHKDSRQMMQARTQSISFLNRAAFAVLMMLICVAVGVTVFPEWKKLQQLEAELDEAQFREKEIIALNDQRSRELNALRNNQEFQELRGRDLLDLYVPGESVIRIERE